jgi:predicted DNA-binding protein
MCMSLLERRLQILLDAERYDRVAGEATRSGRSVAAVIREAIDLRFPDDAEPTRMAAAAALLRLTDAPGEGLGEGPEHLKRAYADELARKVEAR